MQFAELRYVCQEAAVDLVGREDRPLPPTVVLPGAAKTRLLQLTDFPVDDDERHALLAHLADDEITGPETPAWGFVAEAEVDGDDAVVVVYGARGHHPEITASRIDEDGTLDGFDTFEELDPQAMTFLHPLQQAVDSLSPIDPSQVPGPLDT